MNKPSWWQMAPPGFELREKIRRKKERKLPPWVEGNEEDFTETQPDFPAEEQAGLTALGQTQRRPKFQAPSDIQYGEFPLKAVLRGFGERLALPFRKGEVVTQE